MKYSEEGLKVGDRVICIESTQWYQEGDVGVVTLDDHEISDPDYTNIMAIFDNDSMGGLGYYVENNTVKLLENPKDNHRNWLWRALFEGVQ